MIHVDAGARPEAYGEIRRNTHRCESVTLLPRVRSGWASWGIVAAALNGLRFAYELGSAHVAVLSGQDYPLVTEPEVQAFSERHPELSFVASWGIPTPLWGSDGGIRRIRYFHQPVRGRRFYVPVPRRFPRGITPFGGSLYCMLSRAAVSAVLQFADRRRDVVRFYRHAWIPDEMFIPTALLNSTVAQYVVNENLWYMDWANSDGHPKVLRSEDAPALISAAGRASSMGGEARAKLFARKFDIDIDRRVLEILDENASRPPR